MQSQLSLVLAYLVVSQFLTIMMVRGRLPGLLLPFAICSLILIVPTFIYLSVNAPSRPVDDAMTAVSFNKLFDVGDEVNGDVIMPKLGNATAKCAIWPCLIVRDGS
jgi:hypothetical protein